MTDHSNDIDRQIELAAREIEAKQLDQQTETEAIDRVWEKISTDLGATRPLTSCEDFQTEIPAFVAGELSDARALLVGDHTRECVPCRRALLEARSGVRVAPAAVRTSSWSAFRTNALRIAAAIVLCAGGYGAYIAVGNSMADRRLEATIESIDGSLQLVEGSSSAALAPGDVFRARQVLRTNKDSGALFRLADGSLIEMDERSEISLRATRQGSTIDLSRGNIIVHAAKQNDGRLFVDTNDCRVAVKGTIFAVDHGLKGSRVSVIEGEVEVREGAALAVLRPGDQITTGSRLRRVPLEDQFGWSRDAEKHRALLRELTVLRRVVADAVDTAPPRTSTFLLDLAPPDTMFYAAMPNVAEDFDAARAAFYERLEASEVLASWWQETVVDKGFDTQIEELLDRVQPLGDAIGAEAAIAVPASMMLNDGPPVFMAEVDDPETVRQFISSLIEEADADGEMNGEVVLIDDPRTAAPVEAEVVVWVDGDLLAAASDLEALRALAFRVDNPGQREFIGTDLHTRLSQAYAQGVGWIAGVDIKAAMARAAEEMEADEVEVLEDLGILDATTMVIERHRDGDWYATDAEVLFDQPRRGVMAWLAEPAAMGSLEFVSPEAYIAASAVTRDASEMFDDLMAFVSTQDENAFEQLRLFEERFGINIRDDLAATFGGEATLALDGPMLPVPSWKLIVEVYDPETLLHTIERAVAEVNVMLAEKDEGSVQLEAADFAGRTYFTLSREGIDGAVVLTTVDGYMVMAPSRALIEQAIGYRSSGVTLASSDAFRALLPDNGYTDCSALVYRDLNSLLDAVPAEMLGDAEIIDSLSDELSKGLVCVFGESDRVRASATGGSLMGLGSMLGMHGAMQADTVIEEIETTDTVSSEG